MAKVASVVDNVPHFDACYVLNAIVHKPRFMPLGPDALQLVMNAVAEAWAQVPVTNKTLPSDGGATTAFPPTQITLMTEHALEWAERALDWLPLAQRDGLLAGCCETHLQSAEEEWLIIETRCLALLGVE